MKASPGLFSFNAGELSPRLEGRVDFEKYAKGLKLCQNFMPLVQGPITKRPGTYFVHETKNSAKKSRLVRFEYNTEQAYILEFGDQYIRFYFNNGILSGPYEVATPYLEADLAELRFAQSNDILYIAHKSYAPRKLSRLTPSTFSLTTIAFVNGPFGPLNADKSITVYASAASGTGITLTASSSIFTASMVGSFFRLDQVDAKDIDAWEPGIAYSVGDKVRYNNNYYEAVTAGTSNSTPPIHTEGDANDGAGPPKWRYRHSGSGWVTITGYTSGTVVTADVTSRLPENVVGSGNASYKWAYGDWSSSRGYPGAVTFYGDRLFWGGSPARPQTVWGSKVGFYEDHKATSLDDSALTFTLNANNVNTIRWLEGDEKGLLIGTVSGEWVLRPSTANAALTPGNVKGDPSTRYGSNNVPFARVGKAVLFVQRAGRKLREMAYIFEDDGYRSPNLAVRADHISQSGFIDMAYQAQPDSILWLPRADGVLTGFTYERDQDCLAWHRH